MAQATIKLELFKSGMHLTCDDTGHDEFIPHGDGNKLVDLINDIESLTDPDATYHLTDKGEYVLKLMDNEGLSWEEACFRADMEYKDSEEGLIKEEKKD